MVPRGFANRAEAIASLPYSASSNNLKQLGSTVSVSLEVPSTRPDRAITDDCAASWVTLTCHRML